MDLPSQVIMDPGSNPSSQLHSNPPITFEQVPFPHGFPTKHSSVSVRHIEKQHTALYMVNNECNWSKLQLCMMQLTWSVCVN